MRLALLTGVAAAALCLGGVAAAQAETVYVTDPAFAPDAYVAAPGYVATAPGYVVNVPGYASRRYIVTDPAAPVVAEPPTAYVVTPRAVVGPPMPIAPRAYAPAVVPRSSGIVTTGYSSGSCFVDLAGIERCY